MRLPVRALLGLSILVSAPPPGLAACGDVAGDAQAVAAARAAADARTDRADGAACTSDACAGGGTCRHACLCVAPAGGVTCCPGPAAECPRPAWFYPCGDPVCGGHQPQPGVSPCGAGQTPGAPCAPE